MEKPDPPGAQRPRGEHFCALLEHKAALIATVPAAAVSGQGGEDCAEARAAGGFFIRFIENGLFRRAGKGIGTAPRADSYWEIA